MSAIGLVLWLGAWVASALTAYGIGAAILDYRERKRRERALF